MAIGKQAFYKTKGLAYIKCDIPSTSSMSSYNFQNPFFETELSVVFSGARIGDRAFEYAKSTSVVLLEGLKSIGNTAFGGCENIETLSLPNSVETIGQSAFLSCNKLKEIVIPNNVKILQHYIFQNCSKLESVIVGSGVTDLYDRIFYGCVALKSVKFYSKEPPTVKYNYLSLFNIIKQEGNVTLAQRTFDIYVPQESIDKYKNQWGITTLIGF